jgi:hypothetical protein
MWRPDLRDEAYPTHVGIEHGPPWYTKRSVVAAEYQHQKIVRGNAGRGVLAGEEITRVGVMCSLALQTGR